MNVSYTDLSHIVSKISLFPPIMTFNSSSFGNAMIKSKLSELNEENRLLYNSTLLITFVEFWHSNAQCRISSSNGFKHTEQIDRIFILVNSIITYAQFSSALG